MKGYTKSALIGAFLISFISGCASDKVTIKREQTVLPDAYLVSPAPPKAPQKPPKGATIQDMEEWRKELEYHVQLLDVYVCELEQRKYELVRFATLGRQEFMVLRQCE